MHLLGHVGRRVVDDDLRGGSAVSTTPSRGSAARACTCSARKPSSSGEVDEPLRRHLHPRSTRRPDRRRRPPWRPPRPARRPARLASASAPLAWKSTPGRLEGRSTGSAPGSTGRRRPGGARRACRAVRPSLHGSLAPGKKGNRFASPARWAPSTPGAATVAAGMACTPSPALRFAAVDLDRLATPVLHHIDWQVGAGRALDRAGPERVGQDHPVRAGVRLPAPHPGDGRHPRPPSGPVRRAPAARAHRPGVHGRRQEAGSPAHGHRRGGERPARGPGALVAPLRRRRTGPGPQPARRRRLRGHRRPALRRALRRRTPAGPHRPGPDERSGPAAARRTGRRPRCGRPGAPGRHPRPAGPGRRRPRRWS